MVVAWVVFIPLSDPPGDYTYTVTGSGGCVNSTTIHIEALDAGLVQSVTYCVPEPIHISDLVTPLLVPADVVWYDIGYPEIQTEIPEGLFDPAVNSSGIYTGVFINSNECLSTFQFEIIKGADIFTGFGKTITQCDFPDLFCPFELLQNLQPDSINTAITPGGNWIVFDDNGMYLDFLVDWDVCLTASDLAEYGDSLVFKYAVGAPPCAPSFTDLNFHIVESVNTGNETDTSVCVNDPPFILDTLLQGNPDQGLTWSLYLVFKFPTYSIQVIMPRELCWNSSIPEGNPVPSVKVQQRFS